MYNNLLFKQKYVRETEHDKLFKLSEEKGQKSFITHHNMASFDFFFVILSVFSYKCTFFICVKIFLRHLSQRLPG